MTTDTATAPDMINAPPHYRGEGGIEAIDVLEKYDLGLHLGTAVAYLLRAGRKGSKVEDIRKARWWYQRWLNSDPDEPMAWEDALEWRSPLQIVDAFGLKGAHADLVEDLLGLTVFAGVFEERADIVDTFDAAIAEAGA